MLPVALVLLIAVPTTVSAHHGKRCHTKACAKRVVVKHKRNVVRPYSAYFNRVARCESTGRWQINTGNGFFGGLQFTLSSWRAVGGRGYPHHHGRLEQKYRGVKLLRLQGRGAWPVCG